MIDRSSVFLPVPAMIQLPMFIDPRSSALMICSHLETTDRKILAAIKKIPSIEEMLCAKIGTKSDVAYVMLFGGGTEKSDENHVHVNMVRRLVQGNVIYSKIPKVNAKFPEIQSLLEPFKGQKADMLLTKVFFVPMSDIPQDQGLVGPALAEETVGGITMRQVAGKLRIKGGPIGSVEWMIRGDDKEVRIELEVSERSEIAEGHLAGPCERLTSAFQLMVLGERRNVTSTEHSESKEGRLSPPVQP